MTSDIVFALSAYEKILLVWTVLLTLQKRDNLVAVSVRPWFEKVKQFEQLAQILDNLIEERGITPVFVPMEGHMMPRPARSYWHI